MPTDSPQPSRQLPDRPDPRRLKDQAKALLKAGGAQSLSAAQFQVARSYGFASWSKLKEHVEALTQAGQLKAAVDANDVETVKAMMRRTPALHRAPLGYGKCGPLTWVAECRVPREAPSPARLEMAQWMIDNGSDVHQGGDGPLFRAALGDERIPMMELLVRNGADVNARWNDSYPIVYGPCECLAPASLRWLLDHGADLRVNSDQYGMPLTMVIGTYARDPIGRAGVLELFVEHGFQLPDTPTMALHRRRFDLLERHLSRDAGLVSRAFAETEIYAVELGVEPADGLTAAPAHGATLLHLAIEYTDVEMARWLLQHGADPNVRAGVDADGFGGQTPLFHAVVSLGRHDDAKARLLLDAGADPGIRATIRKTLRDMGDPELEKPREFHNVTAVEFSRQFVDQRFVCGPAVQLVEQRGG